jgi:hypothetical protein
MQISDSILIELKSSDNGLLGMNTPAFVCLDNISVVNTVGVQELQNVMHVSVFPNPTSADLSLQYVAKTETVLSATIYDMFGKESLTNEIATMLGTNQVTLETTSLAAGVYFIELKEGGVTKKMKFVKL